MRYFLAACLLGLLASLSTAASAAGAAFEVFRLDPAVAQPSAAEVTSGALDDRFLPRSATRSLPRATDYWLRLTLPEAFLPRDVPTVNVRKGRNMDVEMFVIDHGAAGVAAARDAHSRIRRRAGRDLHPSRGPASRAVGLRSCDRQRARCDRHAFLDLDVAGDADTRCRSRAHDRAVVRRAHGDVGCSVADLVRAIRSVAASVRDAVRAAGAVRRVSLRAGLRVAGPVAGTAGDRLQLERHRRVHGRGGLPVRARSRRAAAFLAARVQAVRLVRRNFRGAGVRQLHRCHRPPCRYRRWRSATSCS